jgi:hypothetical protein
MTAHPKMCNICTTSSSIQWYLCIERALCYISTRYHPRVQLVTKQERTVLVFTCYISNKDLFAVYPKSMHVNRQNFIESLLWLKKHNPLYRNVTINESNLGWMRDKEEANIGHEGAILSTKDTQHYKVLSTKEEMDQTFTEERT